MCHLRFFEIYIDLGPATMHDFNILSSLMGSLCISLTSSATLEYLDFNIRFGRYDYMKYDDEFYEVLRDADVWSCLDTIATHPTGSRLQRVVINIKHSFRNDDMEEPDEDEVLKAVLDGLPLLRTKGILFVEAVSSLDDLK
jgi:hypothetical protein